MPQRGLCWRHIIINTKCSWLHGDERGFRSRGHRIHSSGDYKHPPAPEEHAGLREYMKRRSGAVVLLAAELRVPILMALVGRLKKEGFDVIAGSVAAVHAHLLAQLPDHVPTIRQIVGRCKRAACDAVKRDLQGSIWSADGKFKPVRSRSHQVRAYKYIAEEQEPDAATWSYRDGIFRPPREDPGRR